jgi:hypothetical protein
MIELLSDLLFTLEALEKDWVALHLRVWNFDGNTLARAQVRGLEDRGHAAAGDQTLNLEVVEFFACVDRNHW